MFKNKWNQVNNNENKWNIAFQNFGNNFKSSINWFRQNKDKVKFLIPIAIITSVLMIYMIIKTFINISNLNKESKELYQIKNFNIKVLENNDYTKEEIKSKKTLNDLIN